MQTLDIDLPDGWTLVPAPRTYGPLLDLDELARVLHRDRETIKADRCRAPQRVPPAYKIPGTKEPLWLLDEVLEWLRQHPEHATAPVKPGRPTRPSRFIARNSSRRSSLTSGMCHEWGHYS